MPSPKIDTYGSGPIELQQIKTKRVSTGSVAGGGEADVTVTWDVAFADTNYTAVASVVRDVAGEDLRVRRIRSLAADSIVVNVVNNDSLNARTGTVHALAVHDD